LTEGPDGALYYVDLGYSDIGGTFGVSKIRRIRYLRSDRAPVAVASADRTEGPPPLTVAFSSAGSLDPEGQALSFLWTFGDGQSSTEPNPVHTYVQKGQQIVSLTVSDGVTSTLAPPLFLSVGIRPVATILSPQADSLFRAGSVVSFSGSASDSEDGVLPPSAYTWTIDFLHAGHVHPVLQQTGVLNGTFTIPTSGHDFSGNTRYRITLAATDSDGLQASQAITIFPDKVNVTVDSVPSGLTVEFDGISTPTPFIRDTVKGFQHTLSASDQLQGGRLYQFTSWSDNGARSHTILVPDQNTSFIATFTDVTPPPTAGLVGAWGFNEGTGTTLGDSSGNGRTGTITGATWTTGRFGQALNFTGSALVDLGDLDLTGPFTVMAWMQTRSLYTGTCGSLVMKARDYGFELCSGQLAAKIASGTAWSAAVTQPLTSADLNVWKHVALTYDGTTLRFYLGGVLINTAAGAHTTNNNPLLLGRWTPDSEYWNGLIDEMRIYNRALTQAEVQTDLATAVSAP
jgi:hypothetical protein